LMPGVPCRPHDSAAGRRGDRWTVVRDKGKPDAPMLEGNQYLVSAEAKRPEAV
jgi:hypothetical protein